VPNWRRQSVFMLSERAIKLLLGFLINVAIARHLGPEYYGLIIFAQMALILLIHVSDLGFEIMSIKWFLEKGTNHKSLISTMLVVKLLMSFIIQCLLLVLLVYFPIIELQFIVILSVGLYFSAFNIIGKHYETLGRGDISATARFLGFGTSAGLRVTLIVIDAPILWFAIAMTFEFIVFAAFIGVYYYQRSGSAQWTILPHSESRSMIWQSWPLLFSSLMATLYVSTDIYLIRLLIGSEAVGIYGAGTRFSEAWFSLLAVFSVSVFPLIVTKNSHTPNDNQESYMIKLYGLVVLPSIVVGSILSIFSEDIVRFVFGAEYRGAAVVMAIHVWGAVFVGWRQMSGKLLIAKNNLRAHFFRFFTGFLCNAVLSLILIPMIGIVGAAISSLAAHIYVGYIADFLNVKTRSQFHLKTKSLNFLKTTRFLLREFR
jgi:O-antigen/teichoic acid export membrane protein